MRNLTCAGFITFFAWASVGATGKAYVNYAQFLAEKEQFLSALNVLNEAKISSNDAHLLKANILYRLSRFDEALPLYQSVLDEISDAEQKRNITIRIFDIYLLRHDLRKSIDLFESYEKNYKNVPAKMCYSLGKELFNAGYNNKASNILSVIPKGDEFYNRARYIMAVINIDKRPLKNSVKLFNDIEKLTPVSVEDHSVQSMAILAQARLYVDAAREDIAAKVYQRVPLFGPLGEKATVELVTILTMRAEMAANKEGKFAKASDGARERIEKTAVADALSAIERFRAAHMIDWKTPELLGATAFLYAKSFRYDEARKAYGLLLDHYRPLYDSIIAGKGPSWGVLELNGQSHEVPEVAEEFVRNIPELAQLLEAKRVIKERDQTLDELKESYGEKHPLIEAAFLRQNKLKVTYAKLQLLVEQKVNAVVAERINKTLAFAEYQRAEIARLEMNSLDKQRAANSNFQTEKSREFERELTQIDEGGSL